jgi:hypothetical protein
MDRRFLVPDNINPEVPTLFAIVDVFAMENRKPWDRYRFAEAFGTAFKNSQQIFGYKVASIGEMTEAPNHTTLKDFGGYYYFCFKTLHHPTDKPLLTDGLDIAEQKVERIGWGFHSSRYYPYAIEQAMWSTYDECLKETKRIAERAGIPHAEIMHPEFLRCLEFSDYKKYGASRLTEKPFVPLDAKRTTYESFCSPCDFAKNFKACSRKERGEHIKDNLCVFAKKDGKRVSQVTGGRAVLEGQAYGREMGGELGEKAEVRGTL